MLAKIVKPRKYTAAITMNTNKVVFAVLIVSNNTPNNGKYIVKILRFLIQRKTTAIADIGKYESIKSAALNQRSNSLTFYIGNLNFPLRLNSSNQYVIAHVAKKLAIKST